MNEPLEWLKNGNFYERFRYLYVTKLKKYALIRLLKELVFSKPMELVALYIIGAISFLVLVLIWPFLYWQAKRDAEEYNAMCRNRDKGWH